MQQGLSNFEVSRLDDEDLPGQYNPLAAGGHFDLSPSTVEFLTEVRHKKVKTKCCLCSCSCCCRWTLYLIFVILVILASTVLISLREFIFDYNSTESYYFSDVRATRVLVVLAFQFVAFGPLFKKQMFASLLIMAGKCLRWLFSVGRPWHR